MSWDNMNNDTVRKDNFVWVMLALLLALLIVFVLRVIVLLPYRQDATKSLLTAIGAEDITGVNRLIRKRVNVNAITLSNESIKVTPLTYAVMNNKEPEILRTLIKNGADVNPTGVVGTPLLWAVRRNNHEFVQILTENGADLNPSEYSRTPLMDAASHNSNPEILRILIKNGADINAVDRGGRTPLMMAAEANPNPEILRTLIEKGADVNLIADNGKKAIDYAEENEKLKGTDAYNLLREKTVPPSLKTKPL